VTAVKVAGDVASIVAGVKVKLTPNAAATVIVWLDVGLARFASVAVTVTVNDPEAA
jgi:hypothetical protein